MAEKLSGDTWYHLGTVKWFGGHSNKTGRNNVFGFIDHDGESVFVHRSALQNCSSLDDEQLVLFTSEMSKKGLTAIKAFGLSYFHTDLFDDFKTWEILEDLDEAVLATVEPLLQYLVNGDNLSKAVTNSKLLNILQSLFEIKQGEDFVRKLIVLADNQQKVAKLIKQCGNWSALFDKSGFVEFSFETNLKRLGPELLPSTYITENISKFGEFLSSLQTDKKISLLEEASEGLSLSCTLYLIFMGYAPHPELWERKVAGYRSTTSLQQQIESFVKGTVTREKQIPVDDIVRSAYKDVFSSFQQYSNHPVISPIITPLLMKRKMFRKDMSFVTDLHNHTELWGDPELWFLSTILPLVYAKNPLDDIEKVVLHELWQALLNKHFNVNHPSIFKLFPQCKTLTLDYPHMKLSCEAFYWSPKEGDSQFLCRSRVCRDNKVIPDTEKAYFEYSIFDWLAHYGVNYGHEKAPSKRDFPIKLAGYFNRIRELHVRLHCRCCNQLMLPNMKYARVEIKTIDHTTGNWIIHPVNAAYRLTVFKCNTFTCNEYATSYYINHCFYFNCNQIIDSRDLASKCDEGRYFCPACGSCCAVHAKHNSHEVRLSNPTAKHRELYQDSPSYRSLKMGKSLSDSS